MKLYTSEGRELLDTGDERSEHDLDSVNLSGRDLRRGLILAYGRNGS